MHRIIITLLSLAPIVAFAQEAESPADFPDTIQGSSEIDEGKEVNWKLSLIAGGVSKHLSHKYEPEGGYTEQHSNLGLEIGQVGPGWVASIQATRFNDSHNEDSLMIIGAYGYKADFPYQFFIYGGVGAGYIETSYYSGAIIMPYAELGWWRLSAQGSYLPEFSDTDSGIALQFKFKIFEW